MDVTLAIPAYNEETHLRSTVEEARKALEDIHMVDNFEIIISESSSTDGTTEICRDLEERFSKVHHLELEELRGKGRAVEEVFKNSNKEYFFFMDADGATSTEEFKPMLESLKENEIVVGSRKSNEADRDIVRGVASNFFNYSVKLLFLSELDDHQCGFKGLRRSKVEDLVEDLEAQHWFWDTELLVKAQNQGKDIDTLQIIWEEKDDSEVDIISDSFYFSKKLIKLRIKQWMN